MREISSGRSLARNIRYQEDLVDQLFNSSEETTLYCMTELFRIPVQPFSTIGLTVLSWRHSSTTSILQSRLEDCNSDQIPRSPALSIKPLCEDQNNCAQKTLSRMRWRTGDGLQSEREYAGRAGNWHTGKIDGEVAMQHLWPGVHGRATSRSGACNRECRRAA